MTHKPDKGRAVLAGGHVATGRANSRFFEAEAEAVTWRNG